MNDAFTYLPPARREAPPCKTWASSIMTAENHFSRTNGVKKKKTRLEEKTKHCQYNFNSISVNING